MGDMTQTQNIPAAWEQPITELRARGIDIDYQPAPGPGGLAVLVVGDNPDDRVFVGSVDTDDAAWESDRMARVDPNAGPLAQWVMYRQQRADGEWRWSEDVVVVTDDYDTVADAIRRTAIVPYL